MSNRSRRNSAGGGASGDGNVAAAAATMAAGQAAAAAVAFTRPTAGPQALLDALALVGGAPFLAATEAAHKLRMRFVRGVLLLLQIGDPLGDPAAT